MWIHKYHVLFMPPLLLLYFSQVISLAFFLQHCQLSFLYLLINTMKKNYFHFSRFAIIHFSFNHYFRPTVPLLWPLVKYFIGLR